MNRDKNNPLRRNPFVRIIIPAIAGIVLAGTVVLPKSITILCTLILWSGLLLFRKHKIADIYLWFAVMSFFFAIATINKPDNVLPSGERVVVAAQILEPASTRGRWMNTTAYVGRYRDAAGEWHNVGERVQLAADTSYGALPVGTQIAFRGWVNRIDTLGTSYGKLMASRGMYNKMYLVPGNLLRTTSHTSSTLKLYSHRLQSGAVRKLERLSLDPDELTIVKAMVAGDKSGLDSSLRKRYNLSGSAHVLAVSGLHVGIVFVLVNLLLYFLPAARRGHLLKNLFAIIAIWFYAFVSGLAPSVVRSALMFSFAQLALMSGNVRNGMNVMLGSAVIMLAVNPNYIYDPSFVLSYGAVFVIISLLGPVFSLFRTKNKYLNAVLSVVLIGIIVPLGIAPLISYFFGSVSFAGMIINPAVVLLAHVIVLGGVLWLLMPFGLAAPLFSFVLGKAVGLQNMLVGWSSQLDWLVIEGRMPLWSLYLFYAVFIAVVVYLDRYVGKKGKPLSLSVEAVE